VYLRSLTLKGFKSFPDRTRLDFAPGVSVVVGPNGSGKSNITDAILWALGEQSPLAVRGQAMQDVIFGGGPGVKARSAAEVELVLDNDDGTVELPVGEVSIVRRLDRSGEGEYRMNGARCRLVDVLEALSDTGLGKEAHSVVSQGRIESVVTSKPRDRRLLIEEAAGLSKHRKRRRRAQLKLERTQLNLDRALDVEREARSHLRPLERQARAAELHGRLERQTLEARLELARHALLVTEAERLEAQELVRTAHAERDAIEAELAAVMEKRASAEAALAERAQRNEQIATRLYGARSCAERVQVRSEQVRGALTALNERVAEDGAELARLEALVAAGPDGAGESAHARVTALEAELAEADARHEQEIVEQTAALESERGQAEARRQELEDELERARTTRARARAALEGERAAQVWPERWEEVRGVLAAGVTRALGAGDEGARAAILGEVVEEAERLARSAIDHALGLREAAEEASARAGQELAESERRLHEAIEAERRAAWMIEQRRAATEQGPLAMRRAQLRGELAAERRQVERLARERAERAGRVERLRARQTADRQLVPLSERLLGALEAVSVAAEAEVGKLQEALAADHTRGDGMTGELRACAAEEAEIHTRLRACGERVTGAEVAAGRTTDRAAEAHAELREIATRVELPAEGEEALGGARPLAQEELDALAARLERLRRRREQIGPVNPLAQEEYAEALAHVEELATQRGDLELALRELRAVIRETDRRIQETFDATFERVAQCFQEVIGEVFPGGRGRLRLVEDGASRAGTEDPESGENGADAAGAEAAQGDGEGEDEGLVPGEHALGVEIEVTPAGKSAKRLSLLSGGEKSMTALAFLFAVFLARPCPFYVLDEVEAALDDLNLERFLALLRRCAGGAQFIVMTHQKRTMEAADCLYGVSMGRDGVSKVLSRRLRPDASEHVPPRLEQPGFAQRARSEGAPADDENAPLDADEEPWPRPAAAAVGQ